MRRPPERAARTIRWGAVMIVCTYPQNSVHKRDDPWARLRIPKRSEPHLPVEARLEARRVRDSRLVRQPFFQGASGGGGNAHCFLRPERGIERSGRHVSISLVPDAALQCSALRQYRRVCNRIPSARRFHRRQRARTRSPVAQSTAALSCSSPLKRQREAERGARDTHHCARQISESQRCTCVQKPLGTLRAIIA